jgi:hypothetical protein
MVSVSGTQHRHVSAAPAQKPDDTAKPTHSKSDMSVGHLAKLQPDLPSVDYSAPNAIGKAAAAIAKMTFDQRAALFATPGSTDAGSTGEGTGTGPTDGTETADTGATDGSDGTDATGPDAAGSTLDAGASDPADGAPVDEPTSDEGTVEAGEAEQTSDTQPSSPPTPDDTSNLVPEDAALALLEQIAAAADQASQPA